MATINPPWRLDPLQMIVNVSFQGAYLLYVRFVWSDKVVLTYIDGNLQTPTVITSSVSITDDAPSGMMIYNNVVTIPIDQGDGVSSNEYFQTMVFDVGSLPPSEHPFIISFSISGQEDDSTNFSPATAPPTSSFRGRTSLVSEPGPDPDSTVTASGLKARTGPWVASETLLYQKSLYHIDGSDPLNIIKPNNPHIDPGAAAQMRFISGSPSVFTIPSTDDSYYNGPFDVGQDVITGGIYSVVGFLDSGTLELSLANFPVLGAIPSMEVPVVWPSSPSISTVDNAAGFPLAQEPGTPYLLPNPPPPFNFGVYTVSPDPSGGAGSPETGAYQSGGPPIPDNAYTGTFPEP